jgi:hypothetical protein
VDVKEPRTALEILCTPEKEGSDGNAVDVSFVVVRASESDD